MNFDLRAYLPLLIPKAIDWANACASDIAQDGQSLGEEGQAIARVVGVVRTDLVRIKMVDSLPLPTDPLLRQAAIATGLIGPNMVGMTFGHSIFICDGHLDVWLLSHECRHVYQYEQAGSIEAFLPIYLQQIVESGYEDAPYEIDARLHEVKGI